MIRVEKNKLVSINMLSIIIHGMIGIRILTIPRDVSRYAGKDAWISMIIMYLAVLGISFIFYWISTKYPGHNFSEINEIVLGKFFGRVILIIIEVYVLSSVGLALRVFGDSLKVFLLDNTPMTVIMAVMIFTVVYCIRSGIDTISIVFDILLPFVMIFIFIIIVLTLSAIEPKNLLPPFQHGLLDILRGSLEIVDPVLVCGIIAYVMPYFGEQKKVKKYIFWGITAASLVYLVTILLCLMIFGETDIQYQIYPTLNMGKAVELKTEMFERIESLYMIVWTPNALTTIVLYYLVAVQNLKVFFKTKKDNIFLYGLIPVSLIIALIPEHTKEMLKYLGYNAFLADFLLIIYVPLFAVVVYFKTRRRKAS